MARISRHDQAHRLTVKRLGRVDSHYVSPFESKFDLMSYGKNPPGSSSLKPIFKGIGTGNTDYLTS